MSVYKNETVENFEAAFNSIISQTVPPEEIVLVRDGPVSESMQNAIDKKVKENNSITYIPLEENLGLGNALKEGIIKARNELIARMDSDDISVPNRFELQLKAFEQHPEIDLVGGQVSEFIESVNSSVGKREVPTNHEDIVKYLKKRNAFNHPSVMYKKTSVLKAGNYVEMHFVEDYYLWLRMMLDGCVFMNLPDILVNMRTSPEMYQRRGGLKYYKALQRLEKFKKDSNIVNYIGYTKNKVMRFIQCVMIPNNLRGWIYKKVLRKQRWNKNET